MSNKSIFFNNFFNELNQQEIRYCIMNGYENYPNIIGSDIDIIVNSYNKFSLILDVLAVKLDYIIIQKLEHKYKVANFFIAKQFDSKIEILSLDIYEHYLVEDRILFDSEYFLKDKLQYKNFFIPNNKNECLYYFIKKVVKQDIESNFDVLFNKYDNEIKFEDFFRNSANSIKKSFESKDKTFFSINKNVLREEILDTIKSSKYLKVLESIRVLKRIFRPTGFIISILGPDGSGKSTIIEELKKRELPFRRIDYFHLKPRLLGAKGDGQPVVNPHAKKPYKGLLSYIKLFHFFLDYIVGFLILILPLKIKSSLIIFDRYYDDILVDPKRFRYAGSLMIAKFTRFFLPQPELYFILTTDAQVIYKRKQEVVFEELERQINVYNSLVDGQKYIHIDVDKDIGDIVNEIEIIICKKLNERF